MSVIKRLWRAAKFSCQGLVFAWKTEWAFRFEIVLLILLMPLLFILPQDPIQFFLLLGSFVLVIVCELINTAIENLVDRISKDYHDLSEKIKDAGSASVCIASLFGLSVWLWALYNYFFLVK